MSKSLQAIRLFSPKRRMGCVGASCKRDAIQLMSTRLSFTKDQLLNLNGYFREMVEDARHQNDPASITAVETAVEKLLQRLVTGAGTLDQRFSSAFLISLNEPRRVQQCRFEYLLRIDALSTPPLSGDSESVVSIEEDTTMPGFVRVKIIGDGFDSWQEYMDPIGRLRRDLIKARIANLLAATIKQEVPNRSDDQACTLPGRVIDAEVLDKILKQPNYCRVFYGSGSSNVAAKGRDRVALIEDAGGILLRIELEGYKTREIEVRLLIGIGVSSWPNLMDYPRRVALHHCDALLHYSVSQSGMYAVAVGPYNGARCENRATLWRVRVPAAEKIMNEHYAEDSVAGLTDAVLMEILYQLREGCPVNLSMKHQDRRKSISGNRMDRLRVVSRHILRTIHRWTLERAGPDPLTSWRPDSLSRHVLLALDELVVALRCGSLRCYFHPRCNVMLHGAKGGVLHREDAYGSDIRVLESYLTTLHHRSSSITSAVVPRPLDLMEDELIVKWRSVMASMPRGAMTADDGYSRRQLEYLDLVLKEVLRAKDSLLQDPVDECLCLTYPEMYPYTATEQVENLVYLLRHVLIQARDQIHAVKDRAMRGSRYRRFFSKRRHYNTTSHFDYSVGLVVDIVRRDAETASAELEKSPSMAKMLLRWLYFAMEYDRKTLGPVLRAYLSNLFNGLHEHCYYADSWRKRREAYITEMRSLTTFCKLVVTQKLSPAVAIVDSLSSGWRWAESMVKMIERTGNSLRLIFVTGGNATRYNLTFAENKGPSAFSTWSKARTVSGIARKRRVSYVENKILGRQSTCPELPSRVPGATEHVVLRDTSPLTYVASINRARLRQRAPGDLISAMISLGKFTILREAAANLPREERLLMLDMIQRVARESSRKFKVSSSVASVSDSPRQTYTPRPESDVLDAVVSLSSGQERECVITERRQQQQLQRELRGMHDTLRSNVMPKHRQPIWDSYSVSSWTSSVDSFAGTIARNQYRKQRVSLWQTIRGNPILGLFDPPNGGSPARDSFSGPRNNFEEMISREESPTWSTADNRRRLGDSDSKDGDRLPSWETLESALNEQLYNYASRVQASAQIDRPIAENHHLHTVNGAK